jgi:hypothetical protein
MNERANIPQSDPGVNHVRVEIPVFHDDQRKVFEMRARFRAVRCGRRWGKTKLGVSIGANYALKGYPVGFFAPDYKIARPSYSEFEELLKPVTKSSNKTEGTISLVTGGEVEVWTLENDRAGRSRRYKLVIVDEAAFTKPNMTEIWEGSIKPTLLDFQGQALVMSNTNGVDPDNFFYKICNDASHGFKEYHAPTWNNPLLPLRGREEALEAWQARRAAEFESIRASNPPLVFRQEYEAEFVDWRGEAFFSLDKLLVNGAPVENPGIMDTMFAVVDTAVKTGSKNDGTGVVIYGLTTSQDGGIKLWILDWDIVQIEGYILDEWLKGIFIRMNDLCNKYFVRMGVQGIHIEDANSGSILLQAGRAKGWLVHAIDTVLASKDKDRKALGVVTYHYRGLCKITREAFDKTVNFKGTTYNHFLRQITMFRIGDPDAGKRADDLLDCYSYGLSIGLGNSEGF